MLLDLLTYRCVRFSAYESAHGRDYRSFQRDVQQLRKSCAAAGYSLSKIRDREVVELIGREGPPAATPVDGQHALLTNVALALGEPILRQLGLGNASPSKPDDVFQFVMPRLVDRFLTKPTRAGTCPTQRTVPEAYSSTDVIGFIKGSGSRTEVTVRLSPRVAATAASRLWQKDQVVEQSGDGSAKMTFAVHDVDEVIRWGFGFGRDAEIVAPEAAVNRAREMSSALASLYVSTVPHDRIDART